MARGASPSIAQNKSDDIHELSVHRQRLRRLPARLRQLIIRIGCLKVFRLLDQKKDDAVGQCAAATHMAFEYTCMDGVTYETLLVERSVRTIKNY